MSNIFSNFFLHKIGIKTPLDVDNKPFNSTIRVNLKDLTISRIVKSDNPKPMKPANEVNFIDMANSVMVEPDNRETKQITNFYIGGKPENHEKRIADTLLTSIFDHNKNGAS